MAFKHRPKHSSTCPLKDKCRAKWDLWKQMLNVAQPFLTVHSGDCTLRSMPSNHNLKILESDSQKNTRMLVSILWDLPWCCFEKAGCSRTARLHSITLDWKDARKGQALRMLPKQHPTNTKPGFPRANSHQFQSSIRDLGYYSKKRDGTKGKWVCLLLANILLKEWTSRACRHWSLSLWFWVG